MEVSTLGVPRKMRIALAQINPTVGDLVGNADKIIAWAARAAALEVDIVAFPELAITGYPPEDLVLKLDFIRANQIQLNRVAKEIGDLTAIVGFVDAGADIYNAAAVLQAGQVLGAYHKCLLPNYSVFDEQRYFRAGDQGAVYVVRGVRIGVTICEDIWFPVGPATSETIAGAELIFNINASPFSVGRQKVRSRMMATRAQDEIAYVASVNLVGGQDELIFEGNSAVFDWEGEIVTRGRAFIEDLVVADLDIEGVFSARLRDTRRRQMIAPGKFGQRGVVPLDTPLAGYVPRSRSINPPAPDRLLDMDSDEEIYEAIVLGIRDYVRKSDLFESVAIGLSGGIDSSLTAALAVDALGPKHVVGVSMPSRYSSAHSKDDAAHLAGNLGIRLMTIPIESAVAASLQSLAETFAGKDEDITEENLQARIRANFLMALSNKHGWLVLTTGNKSEVAVGFSTLYGDSAGGFAVLKDVYKTTVFRLAKWRNEKGQTELIPGSVFEKPPSAELRPDQLDVDRLPPYDVLDPILELYVERDRSLEDIVGCGHDRETVQRVIRMVDANEYKRRQQPPGPRISTRAFGKDRRLPITNRYQAG